MIWACLSYNILYVTYFLTNFFDPKPVKRYLTWPNMKNANRLLFGCFKIIQNDSEILKTWFLTLEAVRLYSIWAPSSSCGQYLILFNLFSLNKFSYLPKLNYFTRWDSSFWRLEFCTGANFAIMTMYYNLNGMYFKFKRVCSWINIVISDVTIQFSTADYPWRKIPPSSGLICSGNEDRVPPQNTHPVSKWRPD